MRTAPARATREKKRKRTWPARPRRVPRVRRSAARSRRNRRKDDRPSVDAQAAALDEVREFERYGLARAADQRGDVGMRQPDLDADAAVDRRAVLAGEPFEEVDDAVGDTRVREVLHRR